MASVNTRNWIPPHTRRMARHRRNVPTLGSLSHNGLGSLGTDFEQVNVGVPCPAGMTRTVSANGNEFCSNADLEMPNEDVTTGPSFRPPESGAVWNPLSAIVSAITGASDAIQGSLHMPGIVPPKPPMSTTKKVLIGAGVIGGIFLLTRKKRR